MNANESDQVGGDKIAVGNITGSVAAIGAGAQVIYQQIERALTDIERLEQAEAFERKRLARAVTAYVERLQRQAEQVQDKPGRGNPYKALLEYDIDDAALFYGRSTAIHALLDRLERDALTVLHADSGAGKTSLLKAGILPRLLADGHVPLWVRPRAVPVHQAVKHSLLSQSEQTRNLAAASLHDFLRQVADLLGGKRLIVMLDQFEQVFTEQSAEARKNFVEQLASCLDDDLLPVRWVLALRGEWFTQLATFRPPVQHPFDNEYLLRVFTDAEAREIIIEPAGQRGVTYEPGLADRLIEDLAQEGKIAPPQLQLVCSALFEGLNGQTQVTHAAYDEADRAGGILRNYLDRVLSSNIPREQRQAARRLLEALVTSEKHRASRTRDDLVAELAMQGVSETTVDTLLFHLIESRLLRIEEEAALTYELVHDYLLEEIEIGPEALARKAARELLSQEMQAYKQYEHTLVSADRLDIIAAQGKDLALDVDAFDLLFRSALARGRPLRLWRDYAVQRDLTAALADRWVVELEDEEKAGIAVHLLASLADAAAVSRLTDFIASRSPEGQDISLERDLSPGQRKALIALVQMECDEAETYLRGLTPDGFCFVPAGTFEMGSDERQDEQPKHAVWLPAFWMALSPVTVTDWRRFVEAGGYAQSRYWVGVGSSEREGRWVFTGWQHQRHQADPSVCNLTWYEAMAYVGWLAETSGLPVALPTEAEWEKSAIPCGAQDMADDVLEWTRTEYRPYPYRADDGREAISGDRPRVLRGGAFNGDVDDVRYARRRLLDPALGLSSTGCRICLRLAPLIAEEGDARSANGPTLG